MCQCRNLVVAQQLAAQHPTYDLTYGKPKTGHFHDVLCSVSACPCLACPLGRIVFLENKSKFLFLKIYLFLGLVYDGLDSAYAL
jgi:hypothetical protein